MIKPRSEKELKLMRQSGRITAKALKRALERAKVGVSLMEGEAPAANEIRPLGGQPGFGRAGLGLMLEKNMTIAIETIYAKGNSQVYLKDDGWTYAMKDGSLGGLFEMTVVVGDKKAEVLTDWRKI